MTRRVVIRVHGRVQGVFYRVSARDEAVRLGLRGLVRNEPDGTVVVDVEGEPDAVGAMIDWCAEGSRAADVRDMEVTDAGPVGHGDFTIE